MKHEKKFTLIISKVNELLFSGEAHSVTIPGTEGQITLLAGHEAHITLLRKGIITVQTDTEVKTFAIEKGLLEVSNGQVTLLV